MEDLIDLIATDASPADVSDTIKSLLYAKASERIDSARPIVASTMFDNLETNEEEYPEDQE